MTPDTGLTLLLMFCCGLQVALASASFELQISSMNPSGSDAVRFCPAGRCKMFFRVCLKEYQVTVSPVGPCSFGSASTPVLDSRSSEEVLVVLPINFSWPRWYTLLVEALDFSDSSDGGSVLVEQKVRTGIIRPGQPWQRLQHDAATVNFLFQIRLRCHQNYFGLSCTKFCRPRDDVFGHYDCDRHGNKTCRVGWSGPDCSTALCGLGCSAEHGSCRRPGECRCQYGWRGERCDECVPHPGCVHGNCVKPWECVCDPNFGGQLCEKDLNLCSSLRPCLNGGSCSNSGPDKFHCSCPVGLSGVRCERDERVCRSSPCANGGTCDETLGGFRCFCPAGWTGTTCSSSVCSPNRCAHGGTCVNVGAGFKCICPPQWSGRTCRIDADECNSAPCVHAHSCRNLIGGYFCHCLPGWAGPDCDVDLRICRGRCLNGATCQATPQGGYRCVCTAGHSGERCELDGCLKRPCINGGRCHGERCVCPPGTSGSHCQASDSEGSAADAIVAVRIQRSETDSDQQVVLLACTAVVVWVLTAAVLLLWCWRTRLHGSVGASSLSSQVTWNNNGRQVPLEVTGEAGGHDQRVDQSPTQELGTGAAQVKLTKIGDAFVHCQDGRKP